MKKISCEWCESGDSVMMLDEDGTKCMISKKGGLPCHADGDYWWPCEFYLTPPKHMVDTCPECKGNGRMGGNKILRAQCTTCGGSGEIKLASLNRMSIDVDEEGE